jgi:hypothetical protein
VLKKNALLFAVLYTIGLTIISLISVSGMPSFGTDYDDKFFHILAYFILMMLWYFAAGKNKTNKRIYYISLGCIAFGIIIEAVQGKITLNRVWDFFDIVANIIGILVATLYIFQRKRMLS